MKIIAVGRNYTEHARELNNPVPETPVIFLKPDTAVLRNNHPFYYPSFSAEIDHEIEVVLRVCKEGKHIHPKFADRYYDAVGLGIDFTARDIQRQQKAQGLPWERAKAFDHSAPVSPMVPKEELGDLYDLRFRLDRNGHTVQQGHTKQLIFSFETIITFVSGFMTLRNGDLIFTGTPAGVGPVQVGDRLEGYLDNRKMLDFYVK